MIFAKEVGELEVPIYREREVAGFAQDDAGVDVQLSCGQAVRARYLVGCDGGRSLVRKAAGIGFAGWDPTTSWLIAEAEMSREPQWGFRRDAVGIHAIGKSEDEGGAVRVRLVLTEQGLARTSEPTLRDVWELPLIGVVPGPTAVLIRPDGYVAWVGDQTRQGLVDALTTWFGPPGPVQRDAREIS